MEIKAIILAGLVFFFGCNTKEDLKKERSAPQKAGNYYKFNYTGKNYVVEWGNESFRNISTETFDSSNGELVLVDSGKEAIILSKGCGTSCTYYLVLPLKRDAAEKKYLFSLAYNGKKSLIAYVPEGADAFITVENVITGKKKDIMEDNLCPAAFKGDCIDKCYFEGDYIYLSWQGNKWSGKKSDPHERKIELTEF